MDKNSSEKKKKKNRHTEKTGFSTSKLFLFKTSHVWKIHEIPKKKVEIGIFDVEQPEEYIKCMPS